LLQNPSMSYIWENMGCRCVDNKCVEAERDFCARACRDWKIEKCVEGIYESAFVEMKCADIIECECVKEKEELSCGCE